MHNKLSNFYELHLHMPSLKKDKVWDKEQLLDLNSSHICFWQEPLSDYDNVKNIQGSWRIFLSLHVKAHVQMKDPPEVRRAYFKLPDLFFTAQGFFSHFCKIPCIYIF